MQQLHTAAKDGSSKHGGMHCGYYYVASPDEEKEIKHCNQSEKQRCYVIIISHLDAFFVSKKYSFVGIRKVLDEFQVKVRMIDP